jgi:site-specific DNA-methyltransferase (adenine-specific)
VDVFIRFNEGLAILKKVVAVESGKSKSLSLPESRRFDRLVSSRKPFALETTFKGKATKRIGDLLVYQNGGRDTRREVRSRQAWNSSTSGSCSLVMPLRGPATRIPILTGSSARLRWGAGQHLIGDLSLYWPVWFATRSRERLSYLSCRLTRLLILLHKPSQHVTRKVYTFVPIQKWNRQWTDKDLYEKYDLSASEIAFIEKIVRPMTADAAAEPDNDGEADDE